MEKEDRLLFLIARAKHRLNDHVRQRIREEGIGLSHTQGGILSLLKDVDSLSMTEISRAFDVDNSAITGLVDRLERAGFVTKEPRQGDRRVNLISITEAGRTEVVRAEEVVREINDRIKDGFTEEEIDVFKRVLLSFFDKFPSNREVEARKNSRKQGRP